MNTDYQAYHMNHGSWRWKGSVIVASQRFQRPHKILHLHAFAPLLLLRGRHDFSLTRTISKVKESAIRSRWWRLKQIIEEKWFASIGVCYYVLKTILIREYSAYLVRGRWVKDSLLINLEYSSSTKAHTLTISNWWSALSCFSRHLVSVQMWSCEAHRDVLSPSPLGDLHIRALHSKIHTKQVRQGEWSKYAAVTCHERAAHISRKMLEAIAERRARTE